MLGTGDFFDEGCLIGHRCAGVRPGPATKSAREMVGTTRSRVSFFMNKCRKLSFIECNGELQLVAGRGSARLSTDAEFLR
jgi:hypothetical protein